MEITVKDKEESQKEIQATISAEEMRVYADKAAQTLGRDLEIKGFRKGKAPLDIVREHAGEMRIWEQAAQDALSSTYARAVREHGLAVISAPQIAIVKLAPNNEFIYKATVAVFPKVKLPDIRAVAKRVREKETRPAEFSDGEVERALEWLRKSRAQDGKTPELTDEFAKEVGEFENVADLRRNIAEGLKQEKETKEQERVRLLMIKEIAKKASLVIPPILLEEERHKMMQELESRAKQMGLSMEDYLTHVKKTKDQIQEGWEEKARERVEAGIVLQAIADQEHIEVSDEELEMRLNRYLAHYRTPEEAEKELGEGERFRAYVQGIIRNEKIFEILNPLHEVDMQEN